MLVGRHCRRDAAGGATGQLAAPNEKVLTKRQPFLLDRQEVGPVRLTWTGLDTRLLNRATGRARAQGGRSRPRRSDAKLSPNICGSASRNSWTGTYIGSRSMRETRCTRLRRGKNPKAETLASYQPNSSISSVMARRTSPRRTWAGRTASETASASEALRKNQDTRRKSQICGPSQGFE